MAWDLRYPSTMPTEIEREASDNPFDNEEIGPLVAPGRYTVALARRAGGVTTPLGQPQTFDVVPLGNATLADADRPATIAFQQKVARLQRAVAGAASSLEGGDDPGRLHPAGHPRHARSRSEAARRGPGAGEPVPGPQRGPDRRLGAAARNEPTPPSIADRVVQVVYGSWTSTSAATQTHRQAYDLAAADFAPLLEQIRKAVGQDLVSLENKLEAAGGPWTPGRIPVWKPE